MRQVWIRLMRPLLHFFIILGIFFVTYKLRLVTDLIPGIQLRIPPINFGETAIFALLSGLAFVSIGIIKGLYELYKPIQKYFQTFTKVWIYWFITITFIAYFGWGFIFPGGISRFIIIITAIITLLLLSLFDSIRNTVESKKSRKTRKRILFIANKLGNSHIAIDEIKEQFPYKTEMLFTSNKKEVDDIKLEKYFMIVTIGNFDRDFLQKVFERIRFSDTRFFHVGEGYFLEDVVYMPETVGNIIALEYKHSKLDGWSIVLKRLFDIGASIFGILLASPIMLLISIIIKFDSTGPVIYKQKRVGKGGKEFTFLKFRTMHTHLSTGPQYGGKNAEKLYKKLINSESNKRKGVLAKIEDDPRVTRVGKFLRKTSLDELPQLFSVFGGSMSLVGPRAHLPNEVKKYENWQKRLLSIKPGITGYAQIFGRDNLEFSEEAKLDLYYIQHRSIFLDIYVIFATFGVLFKGK